MLPFAPILTLFQTTKDTKSRKKSLRVLRALRGKRGCFNLLDNFSAFTRHVGISIILALLVVGCAKKGPPLVPPSSGLRTQQPYQIKGVWYYPLPSAEGYVEEGLASWYGREFHGKPTSCGEPYDMYAMTAAHKTLPLGTTVKVTNRRNGREVLLRINDRGPFVAGRIIDLSCRAAQELGSATPGLAPVRVEAVQVASEQHIAGSTYWKVDPVPSFRYGLFAVQIGSFRDQNNASRLKEKMRKGYDTIQIVPVSDRDGSRYRVQVGTYQDILVAQEEMKRLRGNGFPDAFVVAMEGK
jgi:rare lipoprotein A